MYKRFLIIVVLPIILAACSIQGSGKMATRDYAFDGFTGITVYDGFIVTITGGDTFKVSITTDDNVLDVLSVKKDGDMLQVGVDKSKILSIRTTKLEAAITMPELQAVTLGSGCRLKLAQPSPKGTSLTLKEKPGCQVDLSGMPVQRANVTLDAGSKAIISVTDNLDYHLYAGSVLRYTGNPAIGLGKAHEGAKVIRY